MSIVTRRLVGVIIVIVSAAAAIIFQLHTGRITGHKSVVNEQFGSKGAWGSLNIVREVGVNWPLVLLLALCCLVGIWCIVSPGKRT